MIEAIATILVIDDDLTILESIADYLEDRNFRVLKAENGRVGLELLEAEHTDLVLTDLRMPEVDGMEVLQRAADISPETPLIVISGTGHLGDSIRALRLGAWDYIFKPIEDMSIISHAVNKALERVRLLRENRAYQENLETLVRQRTRELEEANANLAGINTRLRKIVETTRNLSACCDVVKFGSALLGEFAKHMLATGGSLFLMEKDGLRMIDTLDNHHPADFLPFPLPEKSILKRAIDDKTPLLVHDMAKEAIYQSSGWEGYRDGSALLFPLPDETGKIAGVLTLHNKVSPPFVEQDREIGTILASSSSETLRAVRSTESLRASQERFKNLVEMLPEAVFETDSDMNMIFANQRALELFGYTKNDHIEALNLFELLAPMDIERVQKDINELMQGRQISEVEYEGLHREGSTFPILVHANTIIKNGQNVGLRGVVVDITARKQSEELIRRSERRYRMLFEKSADAIFVIDKAAGRYLDGNSAALRLTGRTRSELLQLTTKDLIPEGEADYLEKIRSSPESRELGKVTYQRPDGEKRIARLGLIPLDEETVMAISQDITDELAMEAQLIQAQKMEAVGRLAGGVAHDLNNLLSPILGYSEMLLDDFSPNDSRHEFMDEIMHAGLRARDLVRQLLAFSRKQDLAFQPVNINKTISDFEKLLRRTIPEDIAIKVVPAADLRIVMADVGQMEQVIMNLAVNAADAMSNGGRLTIATSLMNIDATQGIPHPDVKPGAYVMLTVADTGCGMAEETREHIFEPFFSTKGERGTGLGLSTVYGIVKQHGGQIWVQSEPGRGTTFKICLPVADKAEVEEKKIKKTASDLHGTETILIVEDNDQVRHMAQAILERQGYTVVTAKDGDQALSILTSIESPVHLLLTDVVMPVMNGRDLYTRAAEIRPDLKVLYMSGYTGDVIAHRGVLEQGIHFIRKPFSVFSLGSKVREALEETKQ